MKFLCIFSKEKLTIRTAMAIFFPAVLVSSVYKDTFIWLSERFSAADTYYSHGFLIPFVTAFLIWLKREEMYEFGKKYNIWGLVLIIFSLFINFLSSVTEVFFISGFSLVFLFFGISLFLYGKEITRAILFPLSFLFFMMPLPLVAINNISFPMKMFATKSAVFILQTALHIPVRNEGFQLFFPNATLVVENPCSGLRSLISLLALGSIFAYLLKTSKTKRILLFLLSIPIALASNLIRVLLLSLGVYIYGNGISKGFFHDLTGYLVFVIAFGALWLFWRNFQCKDFG